MNWHRTIHRGLNESTGAGITSECWLLTDSAESAGRLMHQPTREVLSHNMLSS